MTVAVILGIVALICVTATAISIAVTSRRSVSDAFRALERNEQRHEQHMSKVLDRLMTIKWEDLVAVRATEEADFGGFEVPQGEEEEEHEQEVAKWGALSRMREHAEALANQDALLDEDFPEEGALRL